MECMDVWKNNPDGTIKTKTSCKGKGQKWNILDIKYFESVLDAQISHTIQNAGFIDDKLSKKTYIQSKTGLSYFYAKRMVLEDGVSTTCLNI